LDQNCSRIFHIRKLGKVFSDGRTGAVAVCFFISRITFSKVLLMGTATSCKNVLKISNLLQKSVKKWNTDQCWKTLLNESFWHQITL